MSLCRDDGSGSVPGPAVSSFRPNTLANRHGRIASMKKRIGTFWLDNSLRGES